METKQSETGNTAPLLGVAEDREIDYSHNHNDNSGDVAENEQRKLKLSYSSELQAIITLALGIIVSRGSWVVIKSTDTALLGHVSSEALAASSISDLWTMSTGVFLNGGILGVFVGQALGAGNKKLASIWFSVSVFVLGLLTLPVIALWSVTGPVLGLFHEHDEVLNKAAYYAIVLSLCLPARTLMGQISQFLSANSMVKPEAIVSIFAAIMNLVLGVVFVLGWPIKGFEGFGFKACGWVTVSTEYCQLIILWFFFIYLQQIPSQLNWTLSSWDEITKARVMEYLRLYVPSALSTASDFWRMAVIGAFAAELGDDDVATFNTSYRILWISLTVVGALSFSCRIRLSAAVGAGDITRARFIIKLGICLTMVALLVTTLAVLAFTRDFALLFSDDDHIIRLFLDSRLPMSLTLFFMKFAVFLEGIPYALGKTKIVFYVGVLGSWAGQVPLSYLAIHYWKHDLIGLYYGVAGGYILLTILLSLVISTTDFDAVIREAQTRAEVNEETDNRAVSASELRSNSP